MSDCCCPTGDKTQNKDCCFVCGGKIVYFQDPKEFTCGSCGKVEQGYVACENGHYVCDDCHKAGAFDVIRDIALKAGSKDPFATAEAMMDHPSIPMIGCEHAFITAGAFMSALKNEGSLKVSEEQVIDAMRRADTISKAAYCGLAGTCGIASGLAACFSIILGSSCDKDREYSMTFMAMARATEAIAAEGGPCCDKDFVRTALTVGCQMAKEYFNVKLPMHKEKIICHHFKRGNHCHGGRCAYFPKTKEEVQAAKGFALKLNAAPASPSTGQASTCCSGSKGSETDSLLSKAKELGADEARLIDVKSITVADWVPYKCEFGCKMYGKGDDHPPNTPTPSQAREMLSGYSRAILLRGARAKSLSEAAVALEGVAYGLGYYKAFAMTATSTAPGLSCGKELADSNKEGTACCPSEKEKPVSSCCPTPEMPATSCCGGSEEPTASKEEDEFAGVKSKIRPLMEACGIDVFQTARNNGLPISTARNTFGGWNYYAMLLLD